MLGAEAYDVSSYGFDNRPRARLKVITPTPKDTSILPGEVATQEKLELHNRKQRLLTLVQRLTAEDFGWSFDHHNTRLSHETAEAAISILTLLPMGLDQPRLAPDGEGGLEILWNGAQTTIVIVDGWTLHVVKAAGTPQAEYIPDISFTGDMIPREVLDSIPAV